MSNPRLECFLVGAAGSKKSETAVAFEEASRSWFEERGVAPLSVVDTNRDLEEHQGRRSGAYGDSYVTLANYFNRAAVEDRIRARGDSFLSVGSLVDSIAHINARLQLLNSAIQTPESETLVRSELATMEVLASFFMQGRWQFNFVWYAPLPDQILLPGGNESSYNYDASVDAILRDLNIKMQLGLPVLSGTINERVDQMIADLNKFYQAPEPPVEEERRIISAGDAGGGFEG